MAELLLPDIAGNYLSGLRNAQATQIQQQQAQRQQVVAQQQDTTFAQGQQDRQAADSARVLEVLGPMVRNAKPGDAAGFEQIKQTAIQLGVPADKVSQYTVDQLPALQQAFAASAPGRAMTNEDRQTRLTDAQIKNYEAEARLRNAQADVGGYKPGTGPAQKPLPTGIQKLEDEDISAIQTTQTINGQLSNFRNMIAPQDGSKPTLELGPVNNFFGGVQNAVGASSQNSRNLATFQSTLERLRNDSLRLNKGVQTEGDAQRAWNELVRNINDPGVVTAQLDRIQQLNEIAQRQKLQAINVRRQRNNSVPFDPGQIGLTIPTDGSASTQQTGTVPPAAGRVSSGETAVPLPPKGQPLQQGQLYMGARGPVVYMGKDAQGNNVWQAAQ